MTAPETRAGDRTLGVVVTAGIAVVVLVGLLLVAVVRFGGGIARDPAYATVLAPAPGAAGLPQPARSGQEDASRSGARPAAVDPAWIGRMAPVVGIPAPALRAYADAELTLRAEQPACHLSWNTLAGIGWVESQHGTLGGRVLRDDGRSSRPILGPALDGTGAFAAIRSTPTSSAWHGDRVWEHAVGPLQFLASTWRRWGADGDGDGNADPGDLDDAALAAGRYLCADGHDLATDAGWNAAVHSYNHDDGYVADVAAAATTYTTRAAG